MKIKQISVSCLIMIALFTISSFAQDNVSFSMALTIPAIPGLNTPPYEDQAKNTESISNEKQNTQEIQNEVTAQKQTEDLIKQGSAKIIPNGEGGTSLILETYYSR